VKGAPTYVLTYLAVVLPSYTRDMEVLVWYLWYSCGTYVLVWYLWYSCGTYGTRVVLMVLVHMVPYVPSLRGIIKLI